MDSFFEIGLILAFATVVSVVMQKLRLPLILGHVLTGILVGPLALNLLRSDQTVTVFSQVGITALLFIVGLSMSPSVLRDVGRTAAALGVGQVVFTSIAGFFIVRLFGFSLLASAFLAAALTFSSTIIVSKLLSDRRDLEKLYGKIAVGSLLVQDLFAVAILIVASSISHPLGIAVALESLAFRAIALGLALVAVSVWILPRLTRMFAASQEFLLIFSIGWGVGLAALFRAVGLSIEIGALAAGISLASSPYHHEISAKMRMLRDFFIIMFFVLLGSQITIQTAPRLLIPALVLSAFVLICNPLIVMILMGIMRYSRKTAFYAGLTVAQVSEFSFILLLRAVQDGYVPQEGLSLLTMVGIITIAGSTVMILNADPLYRRFAPLLRVFERKSAFPERHRRASVEAILFGCHRVGLDFLATLSKLGLSFIVVDFDPDVIEKLKDKGVPCRYGDAGDNEFLDEFALHKLKLVISTVPDFETNQFLLSKIRKVNARAVVISLAHTAFEANVLYRDGASYVIMPHYLGGNVAAMLVEKLGHNPAKYAAHRMRHIRHLKGR